MVKDYKEDSSYLLLDFNFEGKSYLLLYDKLRESTFLGQKKGDFDVKPFWGEYILNKKYCLSCELMLLLAPKIAIMANRPPTEIGLSLDKARKIIQSLKQEMDLPKAVIELFFRCSLQKECSNGVER